MVLFLWVVIGVAAGSAANLLAKQYGFVEDIIVGVVGAIIAGWAFVVFTAGSVMSAEGLGMVSSLVGAFILIAVSRGITQGREAI